MQRAGTIADGSALFVPPGVRRSSRSRRLRWGLAGAGLLAAVTLLLLLAPWRTKEPLFRTSPLAKRNITRFVEATGRIDVSTRVEVAPPLSGFVESLVRPGQSVAAGAPLARLDERGAGIALSSAQAALAAATSREAQATAAHGGAVDTLERTRRLAARGLASAGEVSAAETSEAEARAALRAAEADERVAAQSLADAKLQKELRTLAAPIAGVVLDAPDTLITIASPDKGPLFVIGSSLDRLRVDASVAESDIGDLRQGQRATFTVPAYPERSFGAVVEQLPVDATRASGSVLYKVQLSAPNPERLLLSGMTATVRVEVGRVENVLAVREAALRFHPEAEVGASGTSRSKVWRLEQRDRAEPVPVVVGLSDGTFTEIRPKRAGSLKAGDPIVIGWARPEQQSTGGPGISLGTR